LAPLLYFLITGDSFVAVLNSADLDYSDPQVENNMVFLLPQRAKIFELGSNYYIMHPSLLLNPAILVALVVGLPFLLWRLKRSLPAQLLVGMLLVSTVICYVPSIATFLGNHIILPGQLWRLAWPIPLAGLLTVGWMVWEMTCYAQIGLNELKGPRQVVQFFPLVVLCALMVVAAPASVANAKDVYSAAEIPLSAQSRFDPIFRWIGNNIQETSVVFAPDWVNTCIPAYSAQANVVSLRGEQVLRHLGALERRAPGQIEVPQGALDARMFYSRFHLEGKLRILQRHKVDYVMVRAGSHLSATLKSQPGFTAMNTPVVRYTLYAVNRSKLPGS
jgi:hypothetical protein